ncbi:MAG: thioredoxin domain-containing protein [Patescibacteria group bacterium]|jgi:protein-disulfide isomerase
MSKKNDTSSILTIAGMAILLVLGVLMFSSKPSTTSSSGKVDQSVLIKSDSYKSTSDIKKVTLVEFADYECPACGQAAPIISQIASDYKDSVTYVFRNFPLSYHANALVASETAEAAGAQGKFWQMHDMLYSKQSEWSDSSAPLDIFSGYASTLGLDVDKLKASVQANTYKSKIDRDYNDGIAASVEATPTFYINGVKYTGSYAYPELKKALDDAIKNTK